MIRAVVARLCGSRFLKRLPSLSPAVLMEGTLSADLTRLDGHRHSIETTHIWQPATHTHAHVDTKACSGY